MNLINFIQLLSYCFICLLALSRIFVHFSFSRRILLVTFISINVLFVPVFKGCSITMILRGVGGELSLTTSIILLILFIEKVLDTKLNFTFFDPITSSIIALLGVVLYISTFGLVSFDIYSYGYLANKPIITILGYILLQLLMWKCDKKLALIWLISLIGFKYNIQLSNNLWDYLFDPILWLISIFHLIKRLCYNYGRGYFTFRKL